MVAESALATREASGKVAVSATPSILEVSRLQQLIDALVKRGYGVFGPTARDGAIVYDRIEAVDDLPAGWGDEQSPGRYRLKRRDDGALFGYVIGPQSWKKYLHPPEVRLWSAQRQGATFRILNNNNEAKPQEPRAFLGVRPCELAAIAVQDRVLVEDRYRDPIYGARRSGAFLIAVECTQSAATCFCASMGTGPAVASAHAADLVLTELLGVGGHRFLVRAGTERGAELLAEITTTPASKADLQQAETAVHRAAHSQSRKIERDGVRDLLYQNFEHLRWENVAARCLMCANCTMVCPTCFCTTVEDTSDVTGTHAERWRRWDSCFTQSYSYIHGGSVRTSTKARYRHWITHKLATWIDQFGTSGCVGCGRCITWCPAGIDITEEVRAMCEGEAYANP